MSDTGIAKIFYGRSRELDLIKCQLRKDHFLALVSPEKRGKSALLIEGLIPHLINGNFQGQAGPFWKVAHIKGSGDPFGALAYAFSRPGVLMYKKVSPDFEEKIRHGLLHGTTSLARLYRSSARIQNFNLLIIVDNFERLLDTENCPDGASFIKVLSDGLNHIRVPLYVIISVHPQVVPLLTMDRRYRGISRFVQSSQFHLHHLNQADLGLAIEACAGERDTSLDEDTKQKILDELYFDEEQLLHLRDYLLKIRTGWQPERSRKKKGKKPAKIKIQKEEEVPGSAGTPEEKAPAADRIPAPISAVEAERIFSGLATKYQQEVAEVIFTHLISQKETGELEYETLATQEITRDQDYPEEVLVKVLHVFIEAGVITASDTEIQSDTRITITAGVQLQDWDRLLEWLGDASALQKKLDQLRDHVMQYRESGMEEEKLLKGQELNTFAEWWAQNMDAFDLESREQEEIQAFLTYSHEKAPKPERKSPPKSETPAKQTSEKPAKPTGRKKIVIKKRK